MKATVSAGIVATASLGPPPKKPKAKDADDEKPARGSSGSS